MRILDNKDNMAFWDDTCGKVITEQEYADILKGIEEQKIKDKLKLMVKLAEKSGYRKPRICKQEKRQKVIVKGYAKTNIYEYMQHGYYKKAKVKEN